MGTVLNNLRREERHAVKLNALYCITGTAGFKRAKVENISAHGIYLRVNEELSVGSKLDVMFTSLDQSDDGVLVCVEILHQVRDGYGCKVISDNAFDKVVG